MKKMIAIVLAIILYQQWGTIQYHLNPPPDYAAAHDGKVILYGTDWCGYCQKTRVLLTENNIPYVEYDIEKSAEGAEQHKRLGGTGVPVLLIKGQVLKGYSPERILQAVKG
jgi:glutaredoxin